MLYDPKWEQKATPTIDGFISWLAQQNPDQEYDYFCERCAIGQYFESLGTSYIDVIKKDSDLFNMTREWNQKITRYGAKTFGGALQRAKYFAARS